jgi:hypothetical protein
MILLALFLKPIIWFFVFKSATSGSLRSTLLWAAGIAVVLTLADKVSVASNLSESAIALTLFLYGLMSFTLLPLGWKLKKAPLAMLLNLMGVLGAFAGVNFTMDCIRGFWPLINR